MQHVEFWSLTRVTEVTGISKSEIYRSIKAGTFPASHAYKCNIRRFWLSHEVKAWQQSQLDVDVPELRDGLPQDDFESLLVETN